MFAETILLLLSTVGNLLIGLFTFLKNPRRATNWLFFSLTIVIAGWAAATFISNSVDESVLLRWVRLVLATGTILNYVVFLTFYVFPNERLIIKKSLFWSATLFTFVVTLLTQTSYVFTGLRSFTKEPQPGPLLPIFLLHTFLLVGGGIVILIRKYTKAVGIEKKQLGFVLSGIFLTFALILTTNMVLVIFFGNITFLSLGPAFTLIFVGMTAYAIVKHQLLDIRLVIARVLAYGIVIALVAAIYAFALVGFFRFFQLEFLQTAVLVLIIAAMLSFGPIKAWVTRLVERRLFAGEYDPEELTARVAHIGSATIVLDALARGVLKELVSGLRVSYATLVVFKDSKVYFKTTEKQPAAKRAPTLSNIDIANLIKDGQLIFDELPEGKNRQWMRKAGVAISTPLQAEDELVALFVLGDKMNGTAYTLRDIKFLDGVAPAVALAIQNAKAYEEISRFAETLKKKVAEATAELRAANAQLEDLSEMKSNFVSIASHQLRTPIGGIRSYLAMLKDGDLGPVTPKQQEIIQMNMEELRHMLAVIQMFLDATKMEAGKIELERKPTDLKIMVSEVTAELAESAKRKGLALTTTLAAVPKLSLDAERVRNVVLNLVENAIKYTEKGRVAVSLRRANGQIEFRVKDSGIGIAPEEIPKLFAKFVRAGGGFKVSHGSGLGLYIVKNLVEAHGGEAFVESPGVGKGATFGFRLPIK